MKAAGKFAQLGRTDLQWLNLDSGKIQFSGYAKRGVHGTVFMIESDDIATKIVKFVCVDAPQNRSPTDQVSLICGELIKRLGAFIEISPSESCRVGKF